MKTCLIAISYLCAVSAVGQSVPPPCGEKGVPDNVPCYDAKSGKVIHTESPPFVPHQDINPRQPPAEPVVIPKLQPATVTPPDTGVSRVPQNWSYQGNDSCYRDGSNVQCLETSKIQSYVSNRQQFEAQFQAGVVVGGAIGALIRVWMEHRRQVDLERKDIRQQISTYYNAAFELNDEEMHENDRLIATYTRLAQLDPTRRTLYEQGAKDSAAFNSFLATMRPKLGKSLPVILAAKDVKFLRRNLDNAKKTYNITLDGGKKDYVFSQLMQALAGYFEHQQNTQLISSSETELVRQKIADAKYIDPDGTSQSSGGDARHAYALVEDLRHDIEEVRHSVERGASRGPEKNRALEDWGNEQIAQATSSWFANQKAYCREVPDGKYTDLDGKEQSCSPK